MACQRVDARTMVAQNTEGRKPHFLVSIPRGYLAEGCRFVCVVWHQVLQPGAPDCLHNGGHISQREVFSVPEGDGSYIGEYETSYALVPN